jgi:hypothetical protein
LGPARHQKQLRSIQAIVGASLTIYTQAGLTGVAVADGPLSNIIGEMVEQNELVVSYRARRKRGSRAPKGPVLAFVSVPITPLRTRIGLIPFSPHTPHTTHATRHTHAQKRAKGTNRNKHAADYTHTGQPLPVPSLGHSTSARVSLLVVLYSDDHETQTDARHDTAIIMVGAAKKAYFGLVAASRVQQRQVSSTQSP